LTETHRIVQCEPAILDRIEADLDAHGRKEALARGQSPLPGRPDARIGNVKIELRQVDASPMELEVGRPRLEAYLVYLFLMLRGRLEGARIKTPACCRRSRSPCIGGWKTWA